jgi:hypothetical protein
MLGVYLGLMLLMPGASAEDEPRAVARQAVGNYFRGLERPTYYSYLRRRDAREYDSNGKLTERTLATRRHAYVDGVRVSWVVAEDDKPLPAGEQSAAEQAARDSVAEWKRKPKAERERIVAEGRKQQEKEMGYLRDFPEALDFRPAPSEQVAGRAALVYDFSPRKGYRAPNMQARVFEKVRGRIWIDREERHLVRMDAEVFDTVTVGGILAKVEKGTRFRLEQQRLEAGEWFSHFQQIRFDVRVLLVKRIHRQVETSYSEIRPYRGPLWKD